MTGTKKGISACELQRQLGYKRYNTIWDIMHRLQIVMGKRDALYQLTDMVEFDEGYFEKEVSKQTKSILKRGKGSQRQSNVAVMAESTPLEDIETGKVSRHCRYFKITESINSKTFVFSDKSKSYVHMSDYIEAHLAEKSSKETTSETLKWVHIAISNAKRNLLGVYHKIKGEYLQNYLDEFVYKLNRRNLNSIFDRLLVASVYPYWHTND